MRRGALARARARAQSGLLLALVGVVLMATFSLVGLDALHRSAEQVAVEDTLRAGPATAAALKVEISTADEGDLGKQLRAAPLDLVRSIQTEGFPVRHDDSTFNLIARTDAALPARSELIDGRWPTTASGSEIHAALQARAATTLDLEVGDHLAAGSGDDRVGIVIDGIWRPKDPTAVAWFGDPAIASGQGPDGSGPLVVSDSDLERLPGLAVTSYVLTPRSSTDLPRLTRELRKLTGSLDDSDLPVRVTGALPKRLSDLETTRAASDGLLAVAYTLVALAAIVACRQVLALLVEARRTETTLLRSRGATVPGLTRAASAEAAVVAVAGAALGVSASATVFATIGRLPDMATTIVVGIACAAVTVGLAAVATWSSARSAGLRRDEPRDPRGARGVVLVLVLAAAGLSVGQFLAYGGPLTDTPAGGTRIDPITSLAPAAALASLALLGTALAAPFLRLLERLADRRPGPTPALPTRQLSRKLSTFGVAIVLVSLATGFAVLAATLSGTQSSLDDRAAGMRSGADLRLDLTVGRNADIGSEAATQTLIDLGKRAMAVMAVPGRIDQDALSFLAAPSTLPKVATASRAGADSERITQLLHGNAPGVPIGAGAIDVRVDLRGTITDGELSANIWLVDDVGQVAVRPLAAVPADEIRRGPVARTFTVPDNRHTWRFVAVEAKAAGVTGDATIDFAGLPGAHHYDVTFANGLTEGRAVAGAAPKSLPVAITPAVADLIDAHRGDTFDLLLPDSGFNTTVTVAGVVPAIPGIVNARGITADLPTFVAYALATGEDLPAPNSVWVSSPEPDRVARSAGASSIVPTTATTAAKAPSSRIVASAVDVWWWAAAAVIAFAVLAAAAMTASLAQSRRGELQVLQALGLPPRQQSRIRAAELGGAIGVGIVLGLVVGGITTLVTVALLSRSATPGLPAAVEPRLSLVVPGFLGLIVILGLGLVAVAATYAHRTRREAGRLGGRQDFS